MKKYRFIYILGATIAFLSIMGIYANGLDVYAEENYLIELDKDNRCKFGLYPTMIEKEVALDEVKNNGTYDSDTKIYSYKDNKYAILKGETDLEHDFKLSDSNFASVYNGAEVLFKVEALTWSVFEMGDGYLDLICLNIIDRVEYSKTSITDKFSSTDIFLETGTKFYNLLSDKEKSILKTIDSDVYMSLPDYKNYNDGNVKNLFTPTDYAVLKGLSSHLEDPYNHSPFWTKTREGDRIKVIWNNDKPTDCLINDSRIGVVPIIRVSYQTSQGGGGQASSNNPSIPINFNGNVWMMIIGSILIFGGGISLIIIMKKWYLGLKINSKLKVGPKTYVGGGITLTILIIGVYIFSFGTVVKVNTLGFNNTKDIHGYYSGNGYDENFEFGSRILMGLTDDYQVYRYYGNPWDEEGSATNFTYYIQPGIGRWEYKDGLLTIYAAPEWTRYNFEGLETTYTDANGVGSFIKYVGYEGTAYQWYHTNNRDPKYGNVKFGETTEVW